MNLSKPVAIISSIILMAFLAGACGPILPEQGRNTTATNVPTFTAIPPTVTPDVLYITVTPSPPPTQPPLPIFTPDAIQLERWQEYQTELAKVLLYGYGPDASKDALCEWDILGRSGEEVYVWALCASVWGSGSRPAVIYLGADESVKKVSAPGYGSTWDSQIQTMFPVQVQEKFNLYYSSTFFGRINDMRNHLHYRESHPEEQPLVVLSAASTTTPTP